MAGWLETCRAFLVCLPGGPPVGLTRLSCALQPGDIKHDPKNNCTFFSCVKIHKQLISSVSNITCPDFDPSICVPVSGGSFLRDLPFPTLRQDGAAHGRGVVWGFQARSPSFQGSITLMPNGCCKKCEYSLAGRRLWGARCGRGAPSGTPGRG